MTDEAKALVERLEGWARSAFEGRKIIGAYRDILWAVERIETQSREIERLQGLVSSYRLQIDQLHDRAALAGDSHD